MSMALDRDDIYGTEWDFLALDQGGSVALLSSGGFGPIPESVLRSGRSVEAVIWELEAALPVLGGSSDRRQVRPGDYSDWFEMSRRGLYTYDCHGHSNLYEQVSAPSVALRVDDLAPDIAAAAGLLRLPVLFSETTRLSFDDDTTGPLGGAVTP